MPSTLFNGRRAAVSLTYDDALDCHLDAVAPALEARGLRGTFYTPVKPEFVARWDEWAALSRRGHELGNHTLFHPCRKSPGDDWIKPCMDLAGYDADRWTMEVDLANTLLDRCEGRTGRSFGNTCFHNHLGPEDNPVCLEELMPGRFTAARGVQREAGSTIDPHKFNLWNLGSVWGDGLSADALCRAVDLAIARGHWLILTFHHVGPVRRRLTIDEASHTALLDHCAARRDELRTAPVRDILT